MRYFIFAVIFTCGALLKVEAQPTNPNDDPDVPISGIEILLGLGGLYGAKKLMNGKK